MFQDLRFGFKVAYVCYATKLRETTVFKTKTLYFTPKRFSSDKICIIQHAKSITINMTVFVRFSKWNEWQTTIRTQRKDCKVVPLHNQVPLSWICGKIKMRCNFRRAELRPAQGNTSSSVHGNTSTKTR